MPRICYTPCNFSESSLQLIAQANHIVRAYVAQGYDLTLRQLYYQFVSRDLIPNRQSEYKRLGRIINDARLAGLIDWEHIVDRTRETTLYSAWENPADIIATSAQQYAIDRWEDQPNHVEVWIEKDALAGVFERVCREFQVPLLSCRGYTSQSTMWYSAQRLRRHAELDDKTIVVLHFGDHDPSGIDMTRDIQERLELFRVDLEVRRLALNMDQVNKYNPPPNPAKETDSRCAGYIDAYGDESWELDALEPDVLADLVRRNVTKLLDKRAWKASGERQERERQLLTKVSDNWEDVLATIGEEE